MSGVILSPVNTIIVAVLAGALMVGIFVVRMMDEYLRIKKQVQKSALSGQHFDQDRSKD